MTFDYKKPFTTADGRKARLLADDLRHKDYPLVVALSVGEGGNEFVHLYRKDGTMFYLGIDATLINIPERKERWKYVFSDFVSSEFETRDEADKFADGYKNRIGLLRIVYENDRIVEQEYFPLHGEEK